MKKNNKLSTLSDRINHILDLTGTKKADLARAINVAPQVIQFLCGSKTKSSRFTFEIATVMGVNTRWLATGEGEIFVHDDPRQKILNEYKLVPFIPLSKIYEHHKDDLSSIKKDQPWRAVKTDLCNVLSTSLPDASMSPIIPSGADIFIELIEKKQLQDGWVISAHLIEHNSTVIRKLQSKNGKWFLIPENTSLFKPMMLDKHDIILGKVFYYQVKL